MTKLYRSLIAIALSFMCAFVTIGYAAVTTELAINGTATVAPQEGVFITDATTTNSNATHSYLSSVLTSNITCTSASSVTYTITLYNNTNETQYFDQIYSQHVSNNNVKWTTSNPQLVRPIVDENGLATNTPTSIPSKGTLTFTFTFSTTETDAQTLDSAIEFRFLPLDEIKADVHHSVAEGIGDKFGEILNNSDDYSTLTGIMDQGNGLFGTGPYVGNVAGATDNDSLVLEQLFDGKLVYNVNGVANTEVTCMVKQQNIDGVSGDEMTLYLTPVDLKDFSRGDDVAPVYAIVYTQKNGKWVQLGDVYEGRADCNDYYLLDWEFSPSFDTGSWRSCTTVVNSDKTTTYTDTTYTILGKYSYTVSASQTIQNVLSMKANTALTVIGSATTTTIDRVLDELIATAKTAGKKVNLLDDNGGYKAEDAEKPFIKAYAEAVAMATTLDTAASSTPLADVIRIINALEDQVDKIS